MKNLVMTFATVLCCVMISTMFTSCGKDEVESNEYYYYRANGSLDGTNSGIGTMFMISDYTTAIQSVVGDQLTKKDDANVIKACDAVYAAHQAKYGTSVTGKVWIYRKKLGDDNSETTIKEYKY